jgi:hypothetical protein
LWLIIELPAGLWHDYLMERIMPHASHCLTLAGKYVWWKSPENALRDKRHFLASLMTYATMKDTLWMEKNFSRSELLNVLKNPPIGVFTPRAWHFWHYRLGLADNENDIPELPRRTWKMESE